MPVTPMITLTNPCQFFESNPEDGLKFHPIRRLCCGALAGITSVSFTYPLDIVRTRLSIQSASFSTLQAQKAGQLPGMWGTMVAMYTTEGGWRALYRGILPTVAGVAPYVGLNFMVYEMARTFITPAGEKDPSTLGKLAAGATSGAVAQTCTYPLYAPASCWLRRCTILTKFAVMSFGEDSKSTRCPA